MSSLQNRPAVHSLGFRIAKSLAGIVNASFFYRKARRASIRDRSNLTLHNGARLGTDAPLIYRQSKPRGPSECTQIFERLRLFEVERPRRPEAAVIDVPSQHTSPSAIIPTSFRHR